MTRVREGGPPEVRDLEAVNVQNSGTRSRSAGGMVATNSRNDGGDKAGASPDVPRKHLKRRCDYVEGCGKDVVGDERIERRGMRDEARTEAARRL